MNDIANGFNGIGGRWDARVTAKVLGFSENDIQTLVRERLLKPLGAPPPNAPKYFPACEIIKLAMDPKWLDRATRAVTAYWARRNRTRHQNNTTEDT